MNFAYCIYCGKQIRKEAQICIHCGEYQTQEPNSQAEETNIQQSVIESPEDKKTEQTSGQKVLNIEKNIKNGKKEHKLFGVKGWLLFFTIGIAFRLIGYLIDILVAANAINEGYIHSLFIFIILYDFLFMGLFGYSIYLINTHNSKLPLFIKRVFLGNIIAFFLIVIYAYGNADLTVEFSRELFYTIIWATYFTKSKRVKNTFG